MPTDAVVKRSITTTLVACLLSISARPCVAQSPVFPVNSFTTDGQSFPSVCADASGNFVVVWESGSPSTVGQDGSYFGVFGRRFAGGGAARGAEFAINTYTTDYQTFPAIGCGDDGRFVVVWSSFGQDGSNSGVFGQRFDNSGAQAGSEFQVNEYTPGTQDYPAIGVAADGDFVVVWTSDSQDGYSLGIFGQRFSSAGTRTGIEFRVNSYTSGDQSYPAISVSGSGSFVVTWASAGQDGDDLGIFGQRFTSTASESGTEFRVNSATTGAQGYPAVTMDGAGRFVIAWSSDGQDGDDTGVFAQRFASDGIPLGSEFQVNTYTTGTQLFPRLSADDGGELVIVWTSYSQDGDDAGVFGQRFASDGQRAGTEFQVNQSTAGAQYSAAAARVSGGDFVVTWATHDGDASSTDIVGRWFAAATTTPTRTATHTASATVPPPPSATATLPSPTPTTGPPTSTATVPPTVEPTSSPSATPNDTPTATPTDTFTPEPTATPTDTDTATPEISPSATPGVTVIGDCDHDGHVTVSELVVGVNIALERATLDRCAALDRNHDSRVSIDELVVAVREALAA